MHLIVKPKSDFLSSRRRATGFQLTVVTGLICLAGGCTQREKVLDIQTPAGSLEVNKTTSPSGAKGIEIDTSGNSRIEIDATQKKD